MNVPDEKLKPARHPAGLRTLFFTEMWERFSFYGMRALLVLFMVDQVRGGMGLDDQTATAIYGLYSASVYLLALPGGWFGDRVFGSEKAVWYGGIVIALGHITLALPRRDTFFLGLVLVAIGSGLLKSNISALVGKLYPEGGARRDAGFTIFYMGINIGATLGPLICSYLGEQVNWHYGFGAAAIGMFFGLVQFRLTKHRLDGHGAAPETALSPRVRLPLVVSALAIAGIILLVFVGVIPINPVVLARYSTTLILAVAVVFFGSAFLLGDLNRVEKQRIAIIVVLFFASALFWAGFEQVGSSLNLFAERHTQRVITSIGFTLPAGWFQSLGAAFIVMFAPVFASLWLRLAQKKLNPSAPAKFGFGLVLLALGFVIMAGAGMVVAGGSKASPLWLTTTYLLHTFGELCLSPVGLSTVTKLAPPRLVGQMMGSWFLATSLGNILAGLIAGGVTSEDPASLPRQFLNITWLPLGVGVVMVLLAPRIKKWMHGAE